MRDRDPPEQVELAGTVDAGGVLELARHAPEPRPRGADEERRRDEDLRQHDGEGRERDRDPEHRSQRLTEQPPTPEHEEQPEAGHRGRQHDRQVHDGLQQSGAPERASGEDHGQRQAEADGDDQADRGREETQLERVEDGRGRDRVGQRTRRDRPDDEDDDRQAEEQGEHGRDDPERQLPRGDAPGTLAHARPVRWFRRERVAAHAGSLRQEDGGGRNPKPDRIAWPSGPANQVRNFEAASWLGDALTVTPA